MKDSPAEQIAGIIEAAHNHIKNTNRNIAEANNATAKGDKIPSGKLLAVGIMTPENFNADINGALKKTGNDDEDAKQRASIPITITSNANTTTPGTYAAALKVPENLYKGLGVSKAG